MAECLISTRLREFISKRCANRPRPGRLLRHEGPGAQSRRDALGLVPFWAKDIKVGFSNINAKADGSKGSPPSAKHSSGDAASCRSVISADGKQPYTIALADRGLMALAGLWETWRSPAGERVHRFELSSDRIPSSNAPSSLRSLQPEAALAVRSNHSDRPALKNCVTATAHL
jgi:hypothetical protein